ncbi:MAG: fused MFS/spermidine synthase [Flavobacteriales bacterium]|nr:fused MFS/spermidine synthase [Flavobacteriales bacterium]
MEKTTSKFNSQLIVAIQDGKYVLNAKNANYSFATLHKVFQQALKKVEIQNVKSILVLGCGAGSIPAIVYKELGLKPKIDAIEIDEKVIELGNKYFGLDQYSHLNVVIDDAMNFVKSTNNKYDLILVDLFKGINVPEEFLSQHFFEQLKSLLNDNGELLFNYVAYNHETKHRVKDIENVLAKSFSNRIKIHQLENINRVFYVKK